MNGKRAIAKILKIEGIDFVTCFPYNPILDAMLRLSLPSFYYAGRVSNTFFQ